MRVLAVADPLQGLAVLAAGGAAVWVLAAGTPRMRSRAMLTALVAAAAGLATVAGKAIADVVTGSPLVALAGAGAGAVAVLALALVMRRRPHALALLAIGALPFRVPVPVGDESFNLLLPLYAVIAAGCLAYALGWLRRDAAADAEPADDRRRVRLERALAAVVALYAVQALYSTDPEQAIKNACFFYVPFAVLYRLLSGLEWTPRVLGQALRLVAGLAVVFAAIGLVEYSTGHLVVSNPKVVASNELKPYFRVNSLFFDPNIYGRFLALAMIVIGAVLIRARSERHVAGLAACLTVLWAGIVVSLSQSSFAALLVGLAVLAALRWSSRVVVAVAAGGVGAAVAVILVAPGAVGLRADSFQDLNRATSGRLGLVRGGLELARDRPVAGFGSGSFAERYRARKRVRSRRIAAISHTTPITVAAEQGIIGLAGYVALLWTALALVLGGARDAARGAAAVHAIARAAIAAAFLGLLTHTMAYAAFLEDPLTWVLLAAAAAVRAATAPDERRRRAERRAAARGAGRVAAGGRVLG